jgi:hypothetical protein
MKALHTVALTAALLLGTAGVTQAADSPDVAAYKQKLHDCSTQMKTDHPEMNHSARRKACHKQVGPMPKSSAATPAPTPTPSP